jgi:hypothetical protein
VAALTGFSNNEWLVVVSITFPADETYDKAEIHKAFINFDLLDLS